MFDTVFTIDAPAVTTAMLSDPAVQELLARLCSLTTALTFLVYAIAAVIILNGTLYAYKICGDFSRKGEYPDFHFNCSTANHGHKC